MKTGGYFTYLNATDFVLATEHTEDSENSIIFSHGLARILEWISGLEIRDWLLRFTRKEISNLDAISLSNCPKLSDNPRIKTVEYTVA